MTNLPFILSFLTIPGFILAQAELDKVRNMFSPIDESMEISIWKGHFNESHPVELFLGQQANEVKGYYRLISSGEEFMLEGELSARGITLVEYRDEEEMGMLHINVLPEDSIDAMMQATWQSSSRADAINMELKKARYSDYTTNSFRPEVRKYCSYADKTETCITIELIDKQRLTFSLGDSTEKLSLRRNTANKNLTFNISDEENTTEFQEINNTLRMLDQGQFSYYELQNALQFKRINYASSALIMDVEYPETSSESFNKYINEIIATKRKALRREIKENDAQGELHPSATHFQFKWQGWTEIDYLGSSMLSGRMISVISRGEDVEMEVIPFNYDIIEEKNLLLKRQFKSDFSIDSYLKKFIRAELPILQEQETSNPKVHKEDFKHITFSDKHILLSTDYDWTYGITVLRIPHDDMSSLVKRSSILKTLMKH